MNPVQPTKGKSGSGGDIYGQLIENTKQLTANVMKTDELGKQINSVDQSINADRKRLQELDTQKKENGAQKEANNAERQKLEAQRQKLLAIQAKRKQQGNDQQPGKQIKV